MTSPWDPRLLTSARAPAWFNPAVFILAPVAMSFLAWTGLVASQELGSGTSSEALTGFSVPAPVSSRGVGLLAFWYATIVMVSMVGYWWGAQRTKPVTGEERTGAAWFERRYFYLLLAAGAVGVGYSFLKVGGIGAIVESLSEQTANDFSNALSGFAGPQTLRYATILAAPVGIYLWRKKVIGWPPAVAAVLLLLANAMIASRLALLMAVIIYLTAWVRSRSTGPATTAARARVLIALGLIVVTGFAALTTLNYFRNANYYRDAGVDNPVAMNLYQSGAYLAVPAQVSLGVADAVAGGGWENHVSPSEAVAAVQPTFLQFNKVAKDDSWKQAAVYGYSVSFEGNFFTNSVFADTYAEYGLWGWFYTILAYGLAGYAFARMFRLSPVLAASAGVVAYTFFEVWRVQILIYGIVIFLLLLTAAAAALALRVRPPQEQ
ncbi:oligosaccharide repeat unit polymerase [Mycolicibacterium vaccae]|uniref:oligosaccharide repeat unit polymerase n=1 Tax=Mycolicibacterium vaccae TaxID=1810 RepID=UPI003D0367AD